MNPKIVAAETLIQHGLPRTALALLDSLHEHTFQLNRLRRKARRHSQAPRILPGIYVLASLDGCGAVVPLRAEQGDPRKTRALSAEALDAVLKSHDAAQRLLHPSGLPSLRLIFPEAFSLFGKSIGLPAALAFVEKWCGKRVPYPVLATGELGENGCILPVGQREQKIRVAVTELEGTQGLVLVPADAAQEESRTLVRPVRSLDEAVSAVWGASTLPADRALLSLAKSIQQAQSEEDHRKALAILENYPTERLALADRTRLIFAIGIRYRHMGQTEKAMALHQDACKLLPGNQDVLGMETLETLEVEHFATVMDLYDLMRLEQHLRNRLHRPFCSAHNRVRCQGMLAQLLSTVGRYEEALPLREENLLTQERTEAMRHEIPRTLACLTYEAARAGRREIFECCAAELLQKTLQGDEHQARYNRCAIARGLTLLGQHDLLLHWIRGEETLFRTGPDFGLRSLLEPGGTVRGYPDVSTVRALVRALRRSGNSEAAVKAGARIQANRREGLIRWLSNLVEVETALAQLDLGQAKEASLRLSSAVRSLRSCHLHAAGFYGSLISILESDRLDVDKVKRIERELDHVYY